jgi:hypothetical protein
MPGEISEERAAPIREDSRVPSGTPERRVNSRVSLPSRVDDDMLKPLLFLSPLFTRFTCLHLVRRDQAGSALLASARDVPLCICDSLLSDFIHVTLDLRARERGAGGGGLTPGRAERADGIHVLGRNFGELSPRTCSLHAPVARSRAFSPLSRQRAVNTTLQPTVLHLDWRGGREGQGRFRSRFPACPRETARPRTQ